MKTELEKDYEEHIRVKAMGEMDDGDWGGRLYFLKEKCRNEYTINDFKREYGSEEKD